MEEVKKLTRREEREEVIKKLYEIEISSIEETFLSEYEFVDKMVNGVLLKTILQALLRDLMIGKPHTHPLQQHHQDS